jgi:hypothetical protein
MRAAGLCAEEGGRKKGSRVRGTLELVRIRKYYFDLDYFDLAASTHRLRATADHTASTNPNGHAPCRNP